MLGAPKESATSALILFIPRQVALEARSRSAARKKPEPKAMEKKEKKSKSSTEALVLDCAVEKKETKEKKKKSASQLDRAKGVLLRSFAAYLESNGFSKTLVTLRAEAHLEIDDCKATLLNLEEISCKFLELSGHSESSIDWQKEKDPKVGAIARKDEDEEDHDASGQILKKKRKKNRGNDDGRGVGAGVETGSGGHVDMIPNKQSDRSQVISKEKKAKRSCLESHLAESNEVCENKNQKELKRLEDNTDIKELKHDSKCSDHRSVFDDSHVKTKNKRKKKKLVSDSLVEDNGKDQLDADETVENIDHGSQMPNSHSNKKEMETQRDKMISDACHGSEGSNHGKFEDVVKEKVEELKSLINNSSNVSAKPNAVPKQEKRKKKTKETSDSSAENAEQVKLEASDRVMDANSEDLGSLVCENDHKFQFPDKKGAKGEKRKKRRDRSTPDSIHAANFGELDKGISLDGQEKSAVDHKIQEGLKISDSGIENALTFEDRVDDSGKNTSKKRKRLLSEEAGPQIDSESGAKVSKNVKLEIVEHDKETRTVHKADTFLQVNESQNVGKKRKIEKCHETHNESLDTSLSKTGVLMNCNENSSTQASQKEVEGHQMANGHLNEKERNEGTLSKGMKKEKCSTEPKMVNAFQRVKVDQIKFADERLQDNSYWAKDGADNGYGAKAQEILGQVRGRDFRHEKTKKKRGTYRGGQIDCQSHSIKFNYSDDE